MLGATTPEEKLLNLIKQDQNKVRLKKDLAVFKKVNIILLALIVAIAIIFLIDIFVSDYNISELTMDMEKKEEQDIPIIDVFDSPAFDITIEEKKVRIPKEELAKDLNLLGIIIGDNNQAIIEDKKTKKSFFLYKGDRFENFTVYEIKDNKVILDYEGEKIELNM